MNNASAVVMFPRRKRSRRDLYKITQGGMKVRAYPTRETTIHELQDIYSKLSEAKAATEDLFDMAIIGASRYALTCSELRSTITMVTDRLLEMEGRA